MSYTDQKPQIACVGDINNGTSGSKQTKFRCYLCGHTFTVGDYWRYVDASGFALTSPLVCEKCDGPDVIERWRKQNEEAANRFWWFASRV